MLRRRNISLLWLCSFLVPSLASPLEHSNTTIPDAGPSSLPNQGPLGSGIMVTWLWGLVWGDDSTVTVIDRTPALSFNARPAAFGPMNDVLGYMIRVEDFSVPCGDDQGGEIEQPDDDDPWIPGGGEWGVDDGLDEGRQREPWQLSVANDTERGWAFGARHGCPRLCVREHKPESSETWIALVMRGKCTFVEKVREAQRFGAKGVVVGGETEAQDAHGDGLVQMYALGDSSDITIPSTYITHASYETLSTLIASSNTSTWGLRTVSVGITTDPSGWEWYSPLLTFLILLFLPSSLTLCTLLVHRIRAVRAARRERAPEDIVLSLPWRVWEGQETIRELEKSLDNATSLLGNGVPISAPSEPGGTLTTSQVTSELQCQPSTSRSRSTARDAISLSDARKWYETQVECAICLEDFVKGDKLRVLPCRHIFHLDEVDDWLIRRKKLCPICKHDVTRPLAEADVSVQQAIVHSRNNSLERTSLSTIYEEDTEPNERTPLLQRPTSNDTS